MNQRFQLELDEGKKYNEPGISNEFQALNKQFVKTHGWNVLINMMIAISLVVYPFTVSIKIS